MQKPLCNVNLPLNNVKCVLQQTIVSPSANNNNNNNNNNNGSWSSQLSLVQLTRVKRLSAEKQEMSLAVFLLISEGLISSPILMSSLLWSDSSDSLNPFIWPSLSSVVVVSGLAGSDGPVLISTVTGMCEVGGKIKERVHRRRLEDKENLNLPHSFNDCFAKLVIYVTLSTKTSYRDPNQ